MFHKLAPSHADDVDHSKGYALAGWRNTHKLALMGAAPGLTDYNLVALGDNIVYRGKAVRWNAGLGVIALTSQ